MKVRIIILLICLCSVLHANNITHTTYANSTFHTSTQTIVKAGYQTCSAMIDEFIYQFQTDPAQLFTWALKNTGQTHRDDGSDDVVLILNHVEYNPDSAKSLINADFRMSNGFTIRNRNLISYVYDTCPAEGQRKITVDFFYSGSLLKKAYGIFLLEAISAEQTRISLNIDIRFGWFFNIFITQRRYRDVCEWRIGQFIENLRYYGEKRDLESIKKS